MTSVRRKVLLATLTGGVLGAMAVPAGAAQAAPVGRPDLALSIPVSNPIAGEIAAVAVSNIGSAPATNVVLSVLGSPPHVNGRYSLGTIAAGGSVGVDLGSVTASPLFFSGFVQSADRDANYGNNFRIGIYV